ncbi:MAG: nitroreductase [Chloroflexi bacterium]|nr:nitroreductase [Chloroflexota bacterium]
MNDTLPKKNAVCNTCTIRLVRIAYTRAPWFRLVREPLRLGMRGLAWFHRIDPAEYEVRTASCYGCMRFYKVALKEKSALFRWLNDRVNPHFDALLERIVTAEEVRVAKAYAREATALTQGKDFQP